MKRVVVTGATSMIGVALIKRLLKANNIVRIYAIVRPSSLYNDKYRRIPLHDKIKVIECDMENYQNLPNLINDICDTFYHMAWPRTGTYTEELSDILLKCDAVKCVVEAIYTANVLGCEKFIGVGSQSECGIPDDGCYFEDMQCQPVRVDGVLHLAANRMASLVAEKLGVICLWMRVFSVYGIYDRNNSMVNSTIDKLMNGRHCSFTKAEQYWDFVNVNDVAEAFYIVGEKADKSAIYNVASGESRPLIEFIDIIRRIISPKAELGIGELEYSNNPIMKMEVDVSKLRKMGWKPQINFSQGIKEIYNDKIKKRVL